ncbi:hypothetical protein L211DRAFT_776091, partial [Terfezia boudieri ATCC MYA-4762]
YRRIMSDPLSIVSAVFGLVALSAQLGVLSKQLCDFAKDAPVSMVQVHQEIDDLHPVFVEVASFIRGTTKEETSKRGLSMISLHHLMTILTGCVLVFSKLEKKLNECTVDRIKWALWKEAEVGVLLGDLQRHKSSLQLMLSMIQWYPSLFPTTMNIPIVESN